MSPFSRPVFVNGRFLAQKITGVQRFATEIVAEVDRILGEGRVPAGLRDWNLLVPEGSSALAPALKHFRVRFFRGSRLGPLWDQIVLPLAGRGGTLVNLANSGPVLHFEALTVIHDAAVFRTPQNYSRSYRVAHRGLGRALSMTSRICTVSEFSRLQLAETLGISPAEIDVIPNGSDHLERVSTEHAVIRRLGLEPGRYFLTVGSLAPNKNIANAIAAFHRLSRPEYKLVLVGAPSQSVFARADLQIGPNVLSVGHVTDPELRSLYSNALALVFPSLYEGFGIPPLEAMAFGCPILVSDIPAVREVCGPAGIYFDPRDQDSIVSSLELALSNKQHLADKAQIGRQVARRFRWQNSAEQLIRSLAKLRTPS